MTTKRNPKIEHHRYLEFKKKLNGPSNQSKHITSREYSV